MRKSQHSQVINKSLIHMVLGMYTIIALFPVVLVFINSFKTKKAIFRDPLALPSLDTFTLIGYEKVFSKSSVLLFFGNSLIVTVISLALVLVLGAMAAWALSEYKFKGSKWLLLFMGVGIMVPIRLGTVSILELMVQLNLTNTLTALVLVYVAQGLPLAIFILHEFMQQIPKELKEAARCDNVGEYKIFFQVVLPLIRPAIATVAVFSMIPIWNDLWFPLILAPGAETQTITLGVQQFIGQYTTDWNSVLSSLSLAVVPIVILYIIFSRQLIKGLTSGAVK